MAEWHQSPNPRSLGPTRIPRARPTTEGRQRPALEVPEPEVPPGLEVPAKFFIVVNPGLHRPALVERFEEPDQMITVLHLLKDTDAATVWKHGIPLLETYEQRLWKGLFAVDPRTPNPLLFQRYPHLLRMTATPDAVPEVARLE